MRSLAAFWVASSWAVLLLWGCGDECRPQVDSARCEGNTVVSCEAPGVDSVVGARWRRQTCAPDQVCVVSGSRALCALSSEPLPLCATESPNVCEGAGAIVSCSFGFATSRSPCLRCEASDGGEGTCHGGQLSPCANSSGCLPSLRCSDAGYCVSRTDGG